jgi:hypothetical protein
MDQQLSELFRLLDKDGSGVIDEGIRKVVGLVCNPLAELMSIFQFLPGVFSEQEQTELVLYNNFTHSQKCVELKQKIDLDGDGKVSFQEFLLLGDGDTNIDGVDLFVRIVPLSRGDNSKKKHYEVVCCRNKIAFLCDSWKLNFKC